MLLDMHAKILRVVTNAYMHLCKVTNRFQFSWDYPCLKSESPTSQEAPYLQIKLDSSSLYAANTSLKIIEYFHHPKKFPCALL